MSTPYLHSDKPLLTADREIAIARRLEEFRIDIWRQSLSGYEPGTRFVKTWLADELGEDSELSDICADRAAAIVLADPNRRHERALRAELDCIAETGKTRDGASPGTIRAGRRFDGYCARVRLAGEGADTEWRALVESNVRLAISLATSVPNRGVGRDDLVQEAILGLMRAADRFDHRRGVRFSTYATWWIRHSIGHAVSNLSRLVRVPSHVSDLRQRARKVRRKLESARGAPVGDAEVAVEIGVDESRLQRARQYLSAHAISLDAPREDSDGHSRIDGHDRAALDDYPVDPAAIDYICAGELRAKLSELSPMEESILRRRFAIGAEYEHTLAEIGTDHGLSRERIRQIQNQAIAKLRAAYGVRDAA